MQRLMIERVENGWKIQSLDSFKSFTYVATGQSELMSLVLDEIDRFDNERAGIDSPKAR